MARMRPALELQRSQESQAQSLEFDLSMVWANVAAAAHRSPAPYARRVLAAPAPLPSASVALRASAERLATDWLEQPALGLAPTQCGVAVGARGGPLGGAALLVQPQLLTMGVLRPERVADQRLAASIASPAPRQGRLSQAAAAQGPEPGAPSMSVSGRGLVSLGQGGVHPALAAFIAGQAPRQAGSRPMSAFVDAWVAADPAADGAPLPQPYLLPRHLGHYPMGAPLVQQQVLHAAGGPVGVLAAGQGGCASSSTSELWASVATPPVAPSMVAARHASASSSGCCASGGVCSGCNGCGSCGASSLGSSGRVLVEDAPLSRPSKERAQGASAPSRPGCAPPTRWQPVQPAQPAPVAPAPPGFSLASAPCGSSFRRAPNVVEGRRSKACAEAALAAAAAIAANTREGAVGRSGASYAQATAATRSRSVPACEKRGQVGSGGSPGADECQAANTEKAAVVAHTAASLPTWCGEGRRSENTTRKRASGAPSPSSLPRSTASAAAGAGAVAAKTRRKGSSKRLVLPFAYSDNDPRVVHVESCEGRVSPEYSPSGLEAAGPS